MTQTHMSGKRKQAIARATIKPGKGIYRINSMLFENYVPRMARERVRQVFLLADGFVDLKSLDINILVEGGGVMGQADAIACALARAFVKHTENDQLKEAIVKYDRTFIAGDHRQTETHKPSQSSSGPRHKKQKSYR
jgi:small subunit ribosomal protein S9